MIAAVCWIIAMVVFVVVEAATATLVCIWFAGGALAALIVSAFGADVPIQILVFLAVSTACILALRKLAVGRMKPRKSKTNLDRIIGQDVVITQAVDNTKQMGTATINDVEWKVKSEDGEVIHTGEVVKVTDIEGVKLVVKR